MQGYRGSFSKIPNIFFAVLLGFIFSLAGCAGRVNVEKPPIPIEEKPPIAEKLEPPVKLETKIIPDQPVHPVEPKKISKPEKLIKPEKTKQQVETLKPKDQEKSGNAWAFYDSMRLDFGDAQFLDVARNDQEILFQWGLKEAGESQYQAASIRNVGLFYFPKKESDCLPDTIEVLGLRASYVLFYISQAYPEGPSEIEKPVSRTVEGKPAEVYFLSGSLKINNDWKATVRVRPLENERYLFNVLVDGRPKPVLVDWRGNNPENLLPDDEPLEDWRTCWHGIYSHHQDGTTTFNKTITETDGIKTFGDLRVF